MYYVSVMYYGCINIVRCVVWEIVARYCLRRSGGCLANGQWLYYALLPLARSGFTMLLYYVAIHPSRYLTPLNPLSVRQSHFWARRALALRMS